MKIGGALFDDVVYDAEADVLYVHVGPPTDTDGFGSTAEGDAVQFAAADGSLVGLTILNAKLRLEEGGIELTLPEHKVVVRDLADAFDRRLKFERDTVKIPGCVEVDGLAFDEVEYERGLDVLYLRNSQRPAASRGASEEFNPLEFDSDGTLVAITVADARRLLEEEGAIRVTLPDGRRLELPDLRPALAAA